MARIDAKLCKNLNGHILEFLSDFENSKILWTGQVEIGAGQVEISQKGGQLGGTYFMAQYMLWLRLLEI